MTAAGAQFAGRARAFTLVEVLLSLALLATLLLSLNQFLLSMGELWGRNRTQRLFEQHVRAVARHVEDLLQRGARVATPERRLRMEANPVAGSSVGPRLTFELASGDRLLPWPGHPLPDVQCALDVAPERGLLLHWQSRWEVDFERARPRNLVLSPFVERVEYEYYRAEAEAWETREPVAGDATERTLPTRLRLYFRHGTLVAQQEVVVPAVGTALPGF